MNDGPDSGVLAYGPVEQRALKSVALQFWVNGVVFASFIPRLPEVRGNIGVDNGTLGLLLSIGTIGGLGASALCGRAIERFGSKTVMIGGASGLVLALPIIGFANAGIVFLVGVALMHVFDVFTDVAMNMQGSRLSARRHTPVMNRLHGLWSVGTVVGGIGSSALASAGVSLRTHLIAVSIILVSVIAYVGPGLLVEADTTPETPDLEDGSARRKSSLIVLFAVLAVGAITVEIVPSDWATIRLFDDFGLSAGRSGFGFLGFTVGMVVGRLSGDSVAARVAGTTMMRGAVILAGVGMAVGSLVPSAPASVAGFFVAGLGVAVVFPRLYDRAAQAPGRPGDALGAIVGGVRAGAFLVPFCVGSLAATDSLSVGEAMAIVTLPAVALLLVLSGRNV